MNQVIGSIDTSKMKRCYVEGAKIEVECPVCGAMMVHNFSEQYLMYPRVGLKESATFSCRQCDDRGSYHEYEIELDIISTEMVMAYDPKKLKEI